MYIKYRDYINSSKWLKKRKTVLENPFWGRPNECLLCKKTERLAVHHLVYDNLGKERDCDLCILCYKCHEWTHFSSGKKRTDQEAIATNIFRRKLGIPVITITGRKLPKPKKKKRKLTSAERRYYTAQLGGGTYASISVVAGNSNKTFEEYLKKVKSKYKKIILANPEPAKELFNKIRNR